MRSLCVFSLTVVLTITICNMAFASKGGHNRGQPIYQSHPQGYQTLKSHHFPSELNSKVTYEEESSVAGDESIEFRKSPVKNQMEKDTNFKPQYAKSPQALMRLAKKERTIYHSLKAYSENMERRLDRIKRYLVGYNESSLQATSHISENVDHRFEVGASDRFIASNPLLSHRMIRRFSVDLKGISEILTQDLDQELIFGMQGPGVQLANDYIMQYPNLDDLKDSLGSMLLIQGYNNYDVEQFGNGKIGSIQTNVKLTALEVFEIGLLAKNEDQPAVAIEWMELALKKFDDREPNYENLHRSEVYKTLAETVQEHDQWGDKWTMANPMYFQLPVEGNFGSHMPKRQKLIQALQENSVKLRNSSEMGYHIQFNLMTLCKGTNLQSELEKSKLNCWYETQKHPYFNINPLKMELLNTEPLLVQMYDIIGNDKMKKIKNMALPKMLPGPDFQTNKMAKTTAPPKLRPGVSVEDFVQQPFIESVLRKVEFATGLVVQNKSLSKQVLQVTCHGSSYIWDDSEVAEDDTSKLATVMFYLSNVDLGGTTSFPMLGTTANPVAGSAVFWYDLKRNGNVDYRTGHGDCPIVHGIKWVVRKRIGLRENWQRRKCSSNPDE